MQVWYIIPLVLITVLNAYLSTIAGISRIGFWVLLGLQLVPFWAFVAKNSRNVLLDAMVYDSIVAVTYGIGILVFSWTGMRYGVLGGVMLVITGIIMIGLGR